MSKLIRAAVCSLFLLALMPAPAFAADRVPSDLKPGADAYRSPRARGAAPAYADPGYDPGTADPWEDVDDTYAGATDVFEGLPDQPSQFHTLDTADDCDYYTLTSGPNVLWSIETFTSTCDTLIEVRDYTTHELLGWFDDKGADLGSLAHWQNRSQTENRKIYLIVRAANSQNGVGNYEIKVTGKFDYFWGGTTSRVDGLNRFAVAARTGAAMYPGWAAGPVPISDVIVVNGEDRAMADPLAAASLAGIYNAPILTVTANTLPAETAAAIKAIRTGDGDAVNIHVVGGTGSVSAAVYNTLNASKGSGGSIERIAGANRYDLAARIAERVDALWMSGMGRHAPAVLVANGENSAAFPDALAASAVCFRNGWPMVLTQNTKVPSPTAAILAGSFKDSSTHIVNSTTYVPTTVYNSVKHTTSSRMSSHTDRYNSAIDIAKWGMERNILSSYEVALVNKLSDALGAGAYTGWYGGVLLYTPYDGPGTTTTSFFTKRPSMIEYGTIFGGTGSVSAGTFNRVRTMLNPNL